MTEITIKNFKTTFPKIKEDLENAKFITIDTEFSALNVDNVHVNR